MIRKIGFTLSILITALAATSLMGLWRGSYLLILLVAGGLLVIDAAAFIVMAALHRNHHPKQSPLIQFNN